MHMEGKYLVCETIMVSSITDVCIADLFVTSAISSSDSKLLDSGPNNLVDSLSTEAVSSLPSREPGSSLAGTLVLVTPSTPESDYLSEEVELSLLEMN
eukprot:6719487-Ditylum_brightwellii.AAC.1